MNRDFQAEHVSFADDGSETFFVQWRGRQEGPYTAATIEAMLAANKIGLLHEISHEGRWVTIRDYLAARAANVRAQQIARENEERSRREAEREAREFTERMRLNALSAESRQREQSGLDNAKQNAPGISHYQAVPPVAPHRAGMLLAFALIGLLVCGPFALAAWVMSTSDLARMDARLMDESGRGTTSSARVIAILATVLWAIGFLLILFTSV
jgi:hypothetical protein